MRNTPPLEKILIEEKSKCIKVSSDKNLSSHGVGIMWLDSLERIENYLKQRKRY